MWILIDRVTGLLQDPRRYSLVDSYEYVAAMDGANDTKRADCYDDWDYVIKIMPFHDLLPKRFLPHKLPVAAFDRDSISLEFTAELNRRVDIRQHFFFNADYKVYGPDALAGLDARDAYWAAGDVQPIPEWPWIEAICHYVAKRCSEDCNEISWHELCADWRRDVLWGRSSMPSTRWLVSLLKISPNPLPREWLFEPFEAYPPVKRKVGRPKGSKRPEAVRSSQMQFGRWIPWEADLIRKASESLNLPLSTWARRVLLRESRKILRKHDLERAAERLDH